MGAVNWIKENGERMKNWKSIPYWYKDKLYGHFRLHYYLVSPFFRDHEQQKLRF